MGVCFLYGSGGKKDRLKLRVLGGMTAPANPQENDIWVQTDVAISGWEFSETANPTWAMNTGFVYFTSTYSGAYAARDSTGLNFLNQNTIFTKLLGCYQYNGSAWSKKYAYIYHGGGWNQFSGVFSARINVVYPAGSTCTISNGAKTYTAPSTGGYWECDVDSAGTWTVTTTNGPQSASQSVSITASGQTAGVTLSYTLYLYKAGDWREAVTGGWTAYAKSATSGDGQASMPAVTYNSDNVVVSVQSQYGYPAGMYCTNKKVDLTKYRTLKLDGLCSVDRAYITVWSAIGNYTHDNIVAGVQFTNRSRGTVTLDISSLSGEFYVGFRFLGSQASPAMTMYDLYAE